ncbi:hypothetical protein DQ04_05201010 [Trypanosoma grayi]|uniref:hypothetical protein n=1 Tax=Trypanosoma grayi TaxID=71804 RepID=UPI0004F4830B|nr:hypothetical protein DQ04_05201010 [Trypanosoma grayi]KEG09449.1 hypothetical protein DQ04_05201010 [Trypanosoma grayi]
MPASPGSRRIVIAVCGSEKKHQQSFDKLKRYVDEKGDGDGVLFAVVTMCYEGNKNKLTTETGGEGVDVVLHKVSTLHPMAGEALERWCAVATRKRRRRGLPPVIVVDPVEHTQLVLRRSFLNKLLDGRLRRPLCPMPRSWLWARQGAPMTPLGLSSFVLHDASADAAELHRSDGPPGERWWIAKPDISTGDPQAHHMVVWRGVQPIESLPEEVCRLLPSELNAFIVQEFLACALPVVLKVYCIGTDAFVRVVSTAPLLRCVLAQTNGPVFIDSQQKYPDDDTWERETTQWMKYLAKGGRAHAQCTKIAAELAEELQLTLFGFDLLLIPENLSRDGSIRLDAASTARERSLAASRRDAPLLFDEVTGAATSFLCSAVPVLVDVNYFPGFAGMENAEERLLNVIESKVLGHGIAQRRSSVEKENSKCWCC